MTPVDRPRNAKNLVLTEQEAAAMEKYEAQRQAKNDAPLKGDRGAPPVGGETTAPKSYLEFLEQAGGGVVGGYNNFWLSGGDHVIRVDGQPRSSLIIDPPDGQVPPMKPEAVKRNQAFLAGAAAPDASEGGNAGPPGACDGPETRPLAERCTRVDPKTLLYRFTVEDPSTWDRSWTGEYPWNATSEKVYEYACHEGNYSLPGMLRGARQREAEEAGAKEKKP